ncbi:MAG: hypothetical protein JXA57_11675 [Armatimonadetes bacterium]|nr:hypothetical protein [Armatimonadota bacterium]
MTSGSGYTSVHVVALSLLLVWLLGSSARASAPPAQLLPTDQVSGWVLRETPRAYTPENLYEYINGNADLFLSYGFQGAAVGDYVPSDGSKAWITVDIYDLKAALHAFGVYRSERPTDVIPLAVGAEGYSSEGLLAFWQGPYYIKLLLIEGDVEDAARRFAKAIADRIEDPAALPGELQLLPTEKRVPNSERYLKTSALGHRFLNEVVTAEYELDAGKASLYVSNEGLPETAEKVLDTLRQFEAESQADVLEVDGAGEEVFGVDDPYYGNLVAVRLGQFIALAIGEEVPFVDLMALARTSIDALPDEREHEC